MPILLLRHISGSHREQQTGATENCDSQKDAAAENERVSAGNEDKECSSGADKETVPEAKDSCETVPEKSPNPTEQPPLPTESSDEATSIEDTPPIEKARFLKLYIPYTINKNSTCVKKNFYDHYRDGNPNWVQIAPRYLACHNRHNCCISQISKIMLIASV